MYKLSYEQNTDRWHAITQDGSPPYALHCGDSLIIQVAERFLSCRIEMDWDWYLLIGENKFRLHSKEVYSVKNILCF